MLSAMYPAILCAFLSAGDAPAALPPYLTMFAAQAQETRRTEYLGTLRAMTPRSREFEEWLKTSGELPPDFDAMPSIAGLPDPLTVQPWMNAPAPNTPQPEEGKETPPGPRRIEADEWPAQRERLLALLAEIVFGDVPPAPETMRVETIREAEESGATVREVALHFGPEEKALLHVELLIPKGDGPFPVFMTQTNHRAWAAIALRRGYLACVYAGCDDRDDTGTFCDAYPGYGWSKLTRRAWAASRCIDYLDECVDQAQMDQIALTGHSRNGKTALVGAALDERIAAVISSSSGSGGCMPARIGGEPSFGEGIENITRAFPDWFHPRWRFFVGREQKLPVDMNTLVALAAPRPCLLSIARNDGVESTWAMEKTYLSVKPVYDLLKAKDKLSILYRPGGHETNPTAIERYLDWCDAQFGRGGAIPAEHLIHPHDWDGWKRKQRDLPKIDELPERPFGEMPGDAAAWQTRKEALRNEVAAMLGTAPPHVANDGGDYGLEVPSVEVQLSRDEAGRGLEKDDVMFGEYVNADVYMPEGAKKSGGKIPAVLWLHPWSEPRGYVAAYKRGEQAFNTFARAGFAVFCYDQIGFGGRIEEVDGFYNRYPRWSLLGKMVRDAQDALDTLAALPYVDASRMYVVGYGLGAMLAEHLAALDDRPAGYALVCGPPPFRLDANIAETGGIARWAQGTMLEPRLGLFAGKEARVPFDVDELIAAMAPRPILAVTPELDREAPVSMVAQGIESARKIFTLHDNPNALHQEVTKTYNHFDTSAQEVVTQWLCETAGVKK